MKMKQMSRMYSYGLALCLWGGAQVLVAQTDVAARTATEDSLLTLIARVDDDTLRMQWYNQLRRLVIYDDPEKALHYTQEFGKWAQRAGREQEYAMSLFYAANSYIPMGQYEQALASLLAAEGYFQRAEDVTKLGSVQNSIGAVFEAMGRDSLAGVYFQKSYDVFVQLGDSKRQGMALNNLSNVQFRMGNYTASKDLLERAIALADSEEDLQRRYLNYANTLVALHEHAAAEDIYQQLLDKRAILTSNQLCLTYLGIGQLYAKVSGMAKAAPYLTEGLALANQYGFVEEKLDILDALTSGYEATQDYAQAYRYYQDYQMLKDSVSNAEKDKNLVDALTKYETEKKESQIALLETDKALAQRNMWLLALAAMVLLLLAVGAWVLYRSRQKNIHRLEEKNTVISKMLEEKEYLIKEIHHRVKNNLQIISSLLQLQSRYVQEPTALAALNEGESRVRSMSIIHHHLYTDDDLSHVYMPAYVAHLSDNLKASFGLPNQEVRIDQEVADLSLDVGVMIPLGLILNELITNAFKYAFAGRAGGRIRIRIVEAGDQLLISVGDDGVGVAHTDKQGFGSRLIQVFLRKLNATMETSVDNGTEVQIRMPHPNQSTTPPMTT